VGGRIMQERLAEAARDEEPRAAIGRPATWP
jgi:hypothetical protein